ncbi:hypothetical protein EV137_2085 [Kribbella pratensis]|uniref:Uncharacterized protein n=1 Tax=Kribbella pratensis TaxID=2512112 RepID=A0ABY2FPS3_9ACTN|nr:hypothetical protein EV137_2085 [Kribbella pratensis]
MASVHDVRVVLVGGPRMSGSRRLPRFWQRDSGSTTCPQTSSALLDHYERMWPQIEELQVRRSACGGSLLGRQVPRPVDRLPDENARPRRTTRPEPPRRHRSPLSRTTRRRTPRLGPTAPSPTRQPSRPPSPLTQHTPRSLGTGNCLSPVPSTYSQLDQRAKTACTTGLRWVLSSVLVSNHRHPAVSGETSVDGAAGGRGRSRKTPRWWKLMGAPVEVVRT